MVLFKRFKNSTEKQKGEKNEIGNKELKETLGNTALSTLRQGSDYHDLSGLTVEFGYLYDIDGRGIEALFKVTTDVETLYFAVQKGSLIRLSFSEEMFTSTTETFLAIHG